MLIKNNEIRLVISDINMPEMDGLTLLKNIGEKHPAVIPIIVSAYGDMNNIRAAMNLGAFDFVTKPINFEDLNVTVDKTLHHIQNLIRCAKNQIPSRRHFIRIQCGQSKFSSRFYRTDFIQNNHINLYAKMTAAKEIGGDFYDFFWFDKEKTRNCFGRCRRFRQRGACSVLYDGVTNVNPR